MLQTKKTLKFEPANNDSLKVSSSMKDVLALVDFDEIKNFTALF